MRLKIFPFENDIILSEEYISILQINNRKLFNQITQSIYIMSEGLLEVEDLDFIENDKSIKAKDNILFLANLWQFETNHKKIIAKLYDYIENQYKDDTEIQNTMQHKIKEIKLSIQDITNDLAFNISFKDDIKFKDILKLFNIKIESFEHYSLLERALAIIEIVEQFNLYKAIVFYSIKNYFDKKELKELYNYMRHSKIKVMIIEFGAYNNCLPNEKIWYIDEDYEEFQYKW